MKKILKCLCALLMVAGILMNSMSVSAAELSAEDCYKTTISSLRDTVTVSVSLKNKTNLTSGMVAVYYDPEVLQLTRVYYYDSLGLVDVNPYYVEDDYNACSFAWASDAATKYSADMMTMTFKVKGAQNNQKVSVYTDVVDSFRNFKELNSDADPIEYSTTIKMPTICSIFGSLFGWNNSSWYSGYNFFNFFGCRFRGRLWW